MTQLAICYIVQGWNRVLTKAVTSALLFVLVFSFLNINIKICKASDEDILYVGGSGDGNYTYIQDAINDSKNNDTIYVYEGQYFENIAINKSINLIGSSKDNVFIFGNGELYTISIISCCVNISNFTIQNSKIGIFIMGLNYSYNNISQNVIKNNLEGIRLYNSFNNIISKNNIENQGDFAIVCYESCSNVITENSLENNSIGLFLSRWSDNNRILNNSIVNCDVGIKIDYSFSNMILENLIKKGGSGVYLTNSKYNNITYNNIEDNGDYGIKYSGDIKDNIISPNNDKNNYHDLGEEGTPPTVKIPGFEILLVIYATFFILLLSRRYRV